MALRLAHLIPVKPGIAAVEQPPLRLLDGNPGVPRRVPGQRHQQDLRRQSVQGRYRVEAKPALALHLIALPARGGAPLPGAIALPLQPAVALLGGVDLLLH
ncbi:hypothetical protein D3C76_1583420 [compost metagenome]